jgi:hypothetical protein
MQAPVKGRPDKRANGSADPLALQAGNQIRNVIKKQFGINASALCTRIARIDAVIAHGLVAPNSGIKKRCIPSARRDTGAACIPPALQNVALTIFGNGRPLIPLRNVNGTG